MASRSMTLPRPPLVRRGSFTKSDAVSSGGFKPAKLGAIGSISEDASLKAKSKSQPQLETYSRHLQECKDTYGTMSAKARGQKIHNGPLELRQSLAPRDCTAWVREDKQYSPYSNSEQPVWVFRVAQEGGSPDQLDQPKGQAGGAGPSLVCMQQRPGMPPPKTKKAKGPPPLWLPPRAKDPKLKTRPKTGDDLDNMRLGAEAGEDDTEVEPASPDKPPGAGLADRRPWDSEHHIMMSRMNHEVQSLCREYFDKPVKKEGDGIPKVREQYAMNDRQCGWNDEPAPLGENRRTLYDNIGPYNVGGCKDQQMVSYWRKIKDWSSYNSSDDVPLSLSKTGKPAAVPDKNDKAEKMTLLKTVADLPADEAREFWRGWAERQAEKTKGLPTLPGKNRYDCPKGWDSRWGVCWSRANDSMNQRQREYFSVPKGSTGLSTSPSRQRKSAAAIGRIVVDRFNEDWERLPQT